MGINEVWPCLLRALPSVKVHWTSFPAQMRPLASASPGFSAVPNFLSGFDFLSVSS